ncbi:DEAD/DEAH box helicase [Flaviaesturariibacter amylovorans]|uniref:DEAD/DEAH box helicase n=1 Tax=Flaviaesturariibacter amylovorans TaxID=1084520 RepID=A0ABP8HBB8_9BACT
MSQPAFDLPSLVAAAGIDALNPMQEAMLAATEEHPHVELLSPTGSGKTLAFLLPLVRTLEKGKKGTQALIVVPSRELALQIEEVYRKLRTGFKVTATYGGHKREIEEQSLTEAPALIVGTPGRIGDHLRRENIKPEGIHTLVLDEFDKSLELGFREELEFIVRSIPSLERRYLTSATRAEEVPDFVGATDLHTLDFLPEDGEAKDALLLQSVTSTEADKLETLFALLCNLGRGPAIIFCNHRESVERTGAFLTEKSISHVWYHGAMEQRDREVALAKFRNGSASFLVTTDLAARGLDIPHIRAIIHYHLPPTEDSFTHRNGRTARMDASGTAILILGPEEKVPAYITAPVEPVEIRTDMGLPEKPKWTTFFVGAGKKDKVNKIDIVGFFAQKGELKSEDIGLIEVKDFFSFVAIRRSKASAVLMAIKDHKLKGRKMKIDIAK